MLQIIAGKFKGRRLHQVKSLLVRPTKARVRKSMMDILSPFTGLRVLDGFSGVGGLGIEALSRGANEIVFVEKNRRVISELNRNLKFLAAEADCKIYASTYAHFCKNSEETFDMILLDPPYRQEDFENLRELSAPLLKSGGMLAVEMHRAPVEFPDIRIKNYGGSQVVFWRKK